MSRRTGAFLERLKREVSVWLGRDLRIRRDVSAPVEVHGSEYGGAAICPRDLGPGSLVYSLGIGEDVSFDLSLIRAHGVTVHAFDPTPRCVEWIARQNLPETFHFHPWAIADRDGTLALFPPADPDHVSHTVVPGEHTSRKAVDVPARRLRSVAEELGHSRIDLLKIDIEGGEYEVLADWLEDPRRPEVAQVVVEFHHRFSGIPLARTRRALEALRDAGYRVFAVSPRGHEVSLLRSGV